MTAHFAGRSHKLAHYCCCRAYRCSGWEGGLAAVPARVRDKLDDCKPTEVEEGTHASDRRRSSATRSVPWSQVRVGRRSTYVPRRSNGAHTIVFVPRAIPNFTEQARSPGPLQTLPLQNPPRRLQLIFSLFCLDFFFSLFFFPLLSSSLSPTHSPLPASSLRNVRVTNS